MKKRHTIISILCCLLVTTLCCNSQGFNAEKIIHTKWEINRKGSKVILEFSLDSLIETHYNFYNGHVIRFGKPYYLSNNKQDSFDNNKVGKGTSGKYLIDYNSKLKETEYCEIKELTADSLVLFFEFQENHVGAADMYFTYKRIK